LYGRFGCWPARPLSFSSLFSAATFRGTTIGTTFRCLRGISRLASLTSGSRTTVILGLFRISDGDLRAGMFLNVIVLALSGALMIWTARSLRGRITFTEAFLPLLLLNWRQTDNLLWCTQVQYGASTALAMPALAVVARSGNEATRPVVTLIGLAALLLCLCGANGVAFVPGFAVWLVVAGLKSWRAGNTWNGVWATGWAFSAVVLTILYFVGLPLRPRLATTEPAGIRDLARAGASS
jgi:hypothetical protein